MATIDVRIPAIGDFKDVGVIDVLVKPGEVVKAEASLVTLESEKATMDVPSPAAGTVREVKVKVGDRVREGSVIVTLEEAGAAAGTAAAAAAAAGAGAAAGTAAAAGTGAAAAAGTAAGAGAGAGAGTAGAAAAATAAATPTPSAVVHASPAVRQVARELGVDLGRVPGSGPKGRILKSDVHEHVKLAMSGAAPAATLGGAIDLLPWPRVDFAKHGPVETRPLSRIRKISGANLARNWVMIPHVTQFDEADITDLESFRKELNAEQEKAGVKVTLLAFLVKACVAGLARFPDFNASLDGDSLVLKRYFHVGFAADTPQGLMVPVLRDADRKGVVQLAREAGELAARAREGKLAPADLQGGCFSVSSLGGIGGTAFTPIVNAPEVAILGVSRASMKPVWDGEKFNPRLVLPLSLSYDHRVIDGALAARFTTYLAQVLGDLRRLLV